MIFRVLAKKNMKNVGNKSFSSRNSCRAIKQLIAWMYKIPVFRRA